MSSQAYDVGVYGIVHRDVDFLSDTIECILVASSYTPAKNDTHTQVTAGEIANQTGYTGGYGGAGRKTLGSKTITDDTTNHRAVFDGADPSAWTIATGDTVGGIVIAKKGSADDTTMVPLFFLDLTDTPTNGGTVTITFDATGIYYIQN